MAKHNPHVDTDPDAPYFHGHMTSPGVAVVDRIRVPPGRRRLGIGGTLYRAWETNLPHSVTFVHLWASCSAVPFWRRMGFVEDNVASAGTEPIGMGKTLNRTVG